MAQNALQMPSGFGGIMRYDEEYKSLINIKPAHVIGFAVFLVVFRIFLGVVY